MSHSGYHSLDIAIWLAQSSLTGNKSWNNYNVFSRFIRPADVLRQFTAHDYLKIFPDISNADFLSDEIDAARNVTGEVDSFNSIALCSDKNVITNIMSSSLHNGLSRRAWFDSSGRDLYKGNGRIRQESYIIEQGPFQSILINSFQSREIRSEDNDPYSYGGEHHFDIHTFRNKSLFPQLESHEHVNLETLNPVKDFGYSRGHQEDARRKCIDEYFISIIDEVPISNQVSNILDHELSTQILSSIYNSAARQYHGQSGEIREEINIALPI